MDICNSESCQYHALTESVIGDLKAAVQKLTESQEQMKETVIQLAEAFKAMERLNQRIDKLENNLVEKNKEQDKKVDELRIFMYKALGAGMALMGALSIALKFAGVIIV